MICDYVFTNILGCEVEDELRNVVLSNDSLLSNSLSLHLSLSLSLSPDLTCRCIYCCSANDTLSLARSAILGHTFQRSFVFSLSRQSLVMIPI